MTNRKGVHTLSIRKMLHKLIYMRPGDRRHLPWQGFLQQLLGFFFFFPVKVEGSSLKRVLAAQLSFQSCLDTLAGNSLHDVVYGIATFCSTLMGSLCGAATSSVTKTEA